MMNAGEDEHDQNESCNHDDGDLDLQLDGAATMFFYFTLAPKTHLVCVTHTLKGGKAHSLQLLALHCVTAIGWFWFGWCDASNDLP